MLWESTASSATDRTPLPSAKERDAIANRVSKYSFAHAMAAGQMDKVAGAAVGEQITHARQEAQ